MDHAGHSYRPGRRPGQGAAPGLPVPDDVNRPWSSVTGVYMIELAEFSRDLYPDKI